MCVDYTGLNKACPKDPFPLPRIVDEIWSAVYLRGMPKVVDYRETGAQATNKMVTQDRHEVLFRFGRREGVIPTSCV